MTDEKFIRTIGNEAPILAEGRRTPDRREVSLRWLSGTFLTGLTASVLMGVALFAAVEGREVLTIPAEAAAMARPHNDDRDRISAVVKGKRLISGVKMAAKPVDKTIMEVPIISMDGETQVVSKRPFAHVTMALAANYAADADYPPFNPLAMVADTDKVVAAAPAPVFYGSSCGNCQSISSMFGVGSLSDSLDLPIV